MTVGVAVGVLESSVVGVPVAVGHGVKVGAGVGVTVGVAVGVLESSVVGVPVAVGHGVKVGVRVGVSARITVMTVGVTVAVVTGAIVGVGSSPVQLETTKSCNNNPAAKTVNRKIIVCGPTI